MFDIGDVVRTAAECIGSRYKFKVVDKILAPDYSDNCTKFFYKYKLKTLEPINIMNGPIQEQINEINAVENTTWLESELKLIGKTFETDSRICKPQPDKPQEIKNIKIKIDKPKIKSKENNMRILDIYRERKEFEINQNYIKNRKQIIEEDEMQKIIREMELQINTILDIEERLDRVDFSSGNEELLTNVSKEKLEKLEVETDKERDKLHDNIEEIEALFELTEDYEERMKILKKYGIINKDGKLSI